jgi:hypothetical protein
MRSRVNAQPATAGHAAPIAPGRSDRLCSAHNREAPSASGRISGPRLRPPGSSRQRPQPPQPLVSGFTMNRQPADRLQGDGATGLSKRRGAQSEVPSVELSPVGSNELGSFADASRELRDFA